MPVLDQKRGALSNYNRHLLYILVLRCSPLKLAQSSYHQREFKRALLAKLGRLVKPLVFWIYHSKLTKILALSMLL